MDIDLLFTAIKDSDWRTANAQGDFRPESVEEMGYVRSFSGSEAEEIINKNFDENDQVLLVIIDPLRLQSPYKQMKEDGFTYIAIEGAVSKDAIIDKIKLQADKKGKFSVHVKHYD